MDEKFKLLKKEFYRIKQLGLVKSLRSGSTGIGYTFESLLGKTEDNSFYPDFNGIEIKTKLGYSKSCMTLFTLTPKSEEFYNMKKLLDEYGYPDKNFTNYSCLKIDVSCKDYNSIGYKKQYFRLNIDYISKKVFLVIHDYDTSVLNNEFYWTFDEIEERLTYKLSSLAIVTGYPYTKNGDLYYKYLKMDLYKLKEFDVFLNLLENGLIYITFNLDMFKTGLRKGQVHDHGTAFKIKKEALEHLFTRIE